MIDKKLLENLDFKDKEQFLNGLEEIIEHSYTLENEFKNLKSIISDVIDFLPDALWVFDDSGEIFIQNSKAKEITPLITKINSNIPSSEIEYEGKIYLIKSTQTQKKLIISATDITEQKRSERLTSMGKIAAHLAHEIRNTIGAISLLTSTLLNRVQPENKEIVSEIKKSIYRVERIIKSTLLFSKGVTIKRKTFPIQKLQESIEESFEHYPMSKDIELVIEFEDEDIKADFDLLSIVMQNFLYNAIDAIEENDEEEGVISFIYDGESITVKDSGAAIKDENILYEPFKTTKLKGSGLGLSLSLEIIKAHNGKIELLDGEKGFKIWLKEK
jgi:two-component system sensor histidine kinase AtoS